MKRTFARKRPTSKEKPMLTRRALLFTLRFGLTVTFAGVARAQEVPSAPMPAQILSARKVFISNGGADINPGGGPLSRYFGLPVRPYNEFYAAMKTWGRYELVSAPADADLIFEISFSESVLGDPIQPRFRLLVVDPKTHAVLWPFAEYPPEPRKKGDLEKSFETGMASIVNDAKSLATFSAPAPAKN
jgi:hypothetical protein